MMQAADFSDSHHLSAPAWHDGAGVRTILVEREMSAGALVVVEVRGQDATQMALVEDHEVFQTLAANRTDHALDVSILPGCAWRRDDLRDPHRFDSVAEVCAIRPVAI